MSSSLQTIQTLAKIGKVFCKVVFILSIIGAVGSLIGILTVAFIPENLVVDGQTIKELIVSNANLSETSLYAIMVSAIIICVSECVICKLTEKYFKNELNAGTPFTFEGSKQLLKLGLNIIWISIGTAILIGMIYGVLEATVGNLTIPEFNGFSSVFVGIIFLILSVIFKYGAEQNNKLRTMELESNNSEAQENSNSETEENNKTEIEPKV